MPMSEKDFKKLLIDLDLSLTEIGRELGISHAAVSYYFQGRLRSSERRAQIKQYLAQRARERGVHLPEFWVDAEAA